MNFNASIERKAEDSVALTSSTKDEAGVMLRGAERSAPTLLNVPGGKYSIRSKVPDADTYTCQKFAIAYTCMLSRAE